MEFTINLTGIPFNLEYTLESGQVFRWMKKGNWWYAPVGDTVLKVKHEGDSVHCGSGRDSVDGAFVRRYFRLDDDLPSILSSIMKDETMTRAVQQFYGMRLIRQDRW